MQLSVIIPSWNGAALLERHLPAVVREAALSVRGVEVLVVDDASGPGDRSDRVVRGAGPSARLLRQDRRRGFAGTCNAGAEAAAGDVLLFLNNDMDPEPGCFPALLDAHARSGAFAVVPAIYNVRESFWESLVRLRVHRGVADLVQAGRSGEGPAPAGTLRPTAYACGGAALVARADFLALGGFSNLFAPFYWEDADLGWRARRLGRDIVECGDARARHEHAGTIGSRFSARSVRARYECHRLLFTWVHAPGAALWRAHLAWAPARWMAAVARGDAAAAGMVRALGRAAAVARARRALRATLPRAAELWSAAASRGPVGWPANGDR